MRWVKRVMERGQPPTAAPYATTPNGAPFPLRSWPPDAAIDIQNLATWADQRLYRPHAYMSFAGRSLAAGANVINNATGGTQGFNGTWTIDAAAGSAALPYTGLWMFMGYLAVTGDLPTTYAYAMRPRLAAAQILSDTQGGRGAALSDSSTVTAGLFVGTAGQAVDLVVHTSNTFSCQGIYWRLALQSL